MKLTTKKLKELIKEELNEMALSDEEMQMRMQIQMRIQLKLLHTTANHAAESLRSRTCCPAVIRTLARCISRRASPKQLLRFHLVGLSLTTGACTINRPLLTMHD